MDNKSNISGIPVNRQMRDQIRDFSNGLNLTYNETLSYLLSLALNDNESAIHAGFRLRLDATEYVMKKNGQEAELKTG